MAICVYMCELDGWVYIYSAWKWIYVYFGCSAIYMNWSAVALVALLLFCGDWTRSRSFPTSQKGKNNISTKIELAKHFFKKTFLAVLQNPLFSLLIILEELKLRICPTFNHRHGRFSRKSTEEELSAVHGSEASLPLTTSTVYGTPSLLRKIWMKHKKKSEYLGATNSAFEADWGASSALPLWDRASFHKRAPMVSFSSGNGHTPQLMFIQGNNFWGNP